ncbi:MAG: alpha/beta fold hydrolase [Candidatus Thorarchaeota archaeon]|nr:alpha/beta fold hydrolase [Candidatus Thorarchaeota archaeon]
MVSVEVLSTWFESAGEVIRGHLVRPTGTGPFPGICKLHGLPGSPDQVSGIATELAQAGFAMLTFDFRGFRSSEGIFSLSGEIEDARNAITHLLSIEEVTQGGVALYGASFGGAIAICTAARDLRVGAVAVRAPVFDTESFALSNQLSEIFAFVEEIAPDDMHGLADSTAREDMTRRLLADVKTYNPMVDVIEIASRPFLVVTGDADELIDLAGVRRLFARAGEPKTMHVVHGADHVLSEAQARRETNDLIVAWLKQNHPSLRVDN